MTKPQLPRRRAYKPKVQTGCIQCKGVRMKCPEQRPACARCQRLGLDCYYLPLKSKQDVRMGQNQNRASIRQILPATTATKIGILPPSPHLSWYKLEASGCIYLECFREQLALMDQDLEMTDFWLRTVLRASHTDDSITYAIAAIGALARTRKHSSRTFFRNPDPPNNHDQLAHYHTAIMYYNKAISTFRRYVAISKPDDEGVRRNILIITVLFVVFEIFHGNNRAADALTGTGILLLKDKMLHSVSSSRSSLAGLIDDQGIVEAELFLTRCATLCSKASYLTPYAHADGIKAMLMIPSSGLNVPPPPDGDASIKIFSFQFMNLLTAILIWHTRARAHRQTEDISLCNYPEYFQQQRILLDQLQGWIEAYEAQLKRKHPTSILHYFERQFLLTKLAYIVIYCELDPTGDLWDSVGPYCAELTPKFRAHVDAELINQLKPGGSLISLETTFMWGMFITGATNLATECRDRSVRLAWIELAQIATNMSFLKHLRGNVMATALFIKTEEEEEEEEEGRNKVDVIPPSSRYDLDTATWDEASGQVSLRLVAKEVGHDGRRKTKELVCTM